MHQQIRSVPAKSPPDLGAFLRVIAAAGINIRAAGGSDLELGGEFAFSVEDEDQQRTIDVLEREGYKVRVLEPFRCDMDPEKPGELLRCIDAARHQNAVTDSAIADLSIGGPLPNGMVPVFIYSEVRGARQAGS